MADVTYEGPNTNPDKNPHVGIKEMADASADRLQERGNRWTYRKIIQRLNGKS
jgi:hypothetical protein